MLTHDGRGPYAMRGFGLDVPYADAQGSTKLATAGTGTLCGADGTARALQIMLSDLGFYTGKIDGVMGPGTRSAVTAFAAAAGMDAGPYFSQGAICQAIMDVWQAKKAPKPAPAAPATGPIISAATARAFLTPALLAALKTTAPRQTTAPTSAPAGAAGWWAGQSSTTKIGLGVAAAAAVLLGVYALSGKKVAASTPNARRTPRRRPRSRCAITGVRTCRCKPPKGYPKRRSAYALPACWMYPLTTRAKVRNAASRFGKYARRYAPKERAIIAARIDRAKRRFHIGEYR